ncbi:hypothetical protein BJ742DRAFT_899964, partial [Cladochytrium replicatum]
KNSVEISGSLPTVFSTIEKNTSKSVSVLNGRHPKLLVCVMNLTKLTSKVAKVTEQCYELLPIFSGCPSTNDNLVVDNEAVPQISDSVHGMDDRSAAVVGSEGATDNPADSQGHAADSCKLVAAAQPAALEEDAVGAELKSDRNLALCRTWIWISVGTHPAILPAHPRLVPVQPLRICSKGKEHIHTSSAFSVAEARVKKVKGSKQKSQKKKRRSAIDSSDGIKGTWRCPKSAVAEVSLYFDQSMVMKRMVAEEALQQQKELEAMKLEVEA